MADARMTALRGLSEVFGQGGYSNLVLERLMRNNELSGQERAFCTALFYGVVERRITLDWVLGRYSRQPVEKLSPAVRDILRMAVYQLLYMPSVPESAAVNEAVKETRQMKVASAAGYVNGVLRSLQRRGELLPDQGDEPRYSSVKYSMPEWLVTYFFDNWGQNRAKKIMASLNEPAKNDVRVSALAAEGSVVKGLQEAGFDPQPSSLTAGSYALSRGGIVQSTFFKDGLLTVQDEAASLVAKAFDFKPDDQVLDACSAPGGKTIQMAEQVPDGQVTALDIHENKLGLVRQNAARMHVAGQVSTKAADARKAGEYFSARQFDKILIDAPCSGLGLLRRKPEIRYTKSMADLKNLAKIQLAILDHVAPLLKQGGELVYSTCSISVEENEDNVRAFLETHPDFELKPFATEKVASQSGMLKILPDTYHSDGFFIAKFTTRG